MLLDNVFNNMLIILFIYFIVCLVFFFFFFCQNCFLTSQCTTGRSYRINKRVIIFLHILMFYVVCYYGDLNYNLCKFVSSLFIAGGYAINIKVLYYTVLYICQYLMFSVLLKQNFTLFLYYGVNYKYRYSSTNSYNRAVS